MTFDPSGQLDPMNELAARADAGQKIALITLEQVARLAASMERPIDLLGLADGLESHPAASKDPIERRSRTIAAGLIRLLGDRLPKAKPPR